MTLATSQGASSEPDQRHLLRSKHPPPVIYVHKHPQEREKSSAPRCQPPITHMLCKQPRQNLDTHQVEAPRSQKSVKRAPDKRGLIGDVVIGEEAQYLAHTIATTSTLHRGLLPVPCTAGCRTHSRRCSRRCTYRFGPQQQRARKRSQLDSDRASSSWPDLPSPARF